MIMKTSYLLALILANFYFFICCDNHGNNLNPQQESMYGQPPGSPENECIRRIYSECNYPTVFTDEELENVRQFLNYSFTVLADVKPDKPLCPKLYVRHDWKCLSPQQKNRVINVWKVLYERGVVQRLTDIHVKSWPAWHKTAEFMPGHRWFSNEFELAMRKVDPGVTLPYWFPYTYATQPERSSIWDTLGHSGNYSNGYSVSDGIYAEWGLIPTIKRHWSPRGTIYPWFTPEFITSTIQTSNSYTEIQGTNTAHHFNPHLNIGGYEGQYAVREAPYDVLFHVHHSSVRLNVDLSWQLQRRENLTPLTYDRSNVFNLNTGKVQRPSIRTDYLTGAPGITIRETFWVGFGKFCAIPDQVVRPINNLLRGRRDPIPTAAKRLPQSILRKYFPAFNSGNFSAFFHALEEVGECNTRCLPLPKPTLLRETEIGRRQYRAFEYDEGLDRGGNFNTDEHNLYQMWLDLNRAGYCSPYVTTY